MKEDNNEDKINGIKIRFKALIGTLKNSPIYYQMKNTWRVFRAGLEPDPPPPPLKHNWGKYAKLFDQSEKNFCRVVAGYKKEFNWPTGRLFNGQFESGDAETYYAMVRFFKPKQIIEVGAGNSSYFSLQALEKNHRGKLVCIDPSPRVKLPKEVEHMPAMVEEASLEKFANLEKNDILFIDSSHTTQEARYHVNKILPVLKPGVLIHHHDILYPYARYHHNKPKIYGEPKVVLDFYQKNPDKYRIFIGLAYIKFTRPKLLLGTMPKFKKMVYRVPGSLWTMKIG